MPDDRLRRDYDTVENLDDLITAREERVSGFEDDVDALSDWDHGKVPRDAGEQLTYPHPKPSSDEYGRLGENVELMDTPNETEIEFDWQDSVEEMLPTDPEPDEGMGLDQVMESISHVEAADLEGPVPSTEVSPETDTASTREEQQEYETDGGDRNCPPPGPVQLETGMDTDSDEMDFTIEDKFAGQTTHEEAEYEFEMIQEAIEEEQKTDENQ